MTETTTQQEEATIENRVLTPSFFKVVVAECHGDEKKAHRFFARAMHNFRMKPDLTTYALAAPETARLTQVALLKFAAHDFPFTGDFIFFSAPYNTKNNKGEYNPPAADFYYRGLAALCSRMEGFLLYHPIVVLWEDEFSISTELTATGKQIKIHHAPKMPDKAESVDTIIQKDDKGTEYERQNVNTDIKFSDIRGVVISWQYNGVTDAHFVPHKWLAAARDNAHTDYTRQLQRDKWDKNPRIFAEKTAFKRTIPFLPVAIREYAGDLEGEVIAGYDPTKDAVSPAQPATPPPNTPNPPPEMEMTAMPTPPTKDEPKPAAPAQANKDAPPPDLSAKPAEEQSPATPNPANPDDIPF
ncbi:MAG: hypothetical protein ACR2PR_09105 [Pseudohongiellaceae bacterium]